MDSTVKQSLKMDGGGLVKIVWRYPTLFFFCTGCLVGWFAWGQSGEIGSLLWLLLLPLGWGYTKSRGSATVLMGGYYLVCSRGSVNAVGVFYGDAVPSWSGWFMCGCLCVLLTLPFVLLWRQSILGRPWQFVFGVCLSAIPPLAIVGGFSPLVLAGLMFPSVGWVGLLLTLGLMGAVVVRNRRWLVVLGVMALGSNALAVITPSSAPMGWIGINTTFPRLAGGVAGDAGALLAGMARVEWIKTFAASIPANTVVVLPETVLGSFDAIAQYALKETTEKLRGRKSHILVGAEVWTSEKQYKNAVVVLGASKLEDKMAVQNIPVPIAMWQPWTGEGAIGHVFGHTNIMRVNGQSVGVMVCYEQLLAYSLLWTMLEQPDVLVGVSNVWWVNGATVPNIQSQTMLSFGRLFGVGVVMAKNGSWDQVDGWLKAR